MRTDYVTASERLKFVAINREELYFRECEGCGRNSDEIVIDDGCTYEELEWSSKTCNSGSWFCHDDCYRDCR